MTWSRQPTDVTPSSQNTTGILGSATIASKGQGHSGIQSSLGQQNDQSSGSDRQTGQGNVNHALLQEVQSIVKEAGCLLQRAGQLLQDQQLWPSTDLSSRERNDNHSWRFSSSSNPHGQPLDLYSSQMGYGSFIQSGQSSSQVGSSGFGGSSGRLGGGSSGQSGGADQYDGQSSEYNKRFQRFKGDMPLFGGVGPHNLPDTIYSKIDLYAPLLPGGTPITTCFCYRAAP